MHSPPQNVIGKSGSSSKRLREYQGSNRPTPKRTSTDTQSTSHRDTYELRPLIQSFFPSCSFAAATNLSGSKPNFLCSSLRGAEAPNVFIPMTRPVGPT